MAPTQRARQRFRLVSAIFSDLQAQHPKLCQYALQIGSFKKCLAKCNFRLKLIRFSADALDSASLDTLYHVLIHETAHALCGPRRLHHGAAWYAMCKRLGQDKPEVVYNFVTSCSGALSSRDYTKWRRKINALAYYM